jgi:hypothetical protein
MPNSNQPNQPHVPREVHDIIFRGICAQLDQKHEILTRAQVLQDYLGIIIRTVLSLTLASI